MVVLFLWVGVLDDERSPGGSKPGGLGFRGGYLDGQGDLVRGLITLISHATTPVIPIISLVTKSPWPSK